MIDNGQRMLLGYFPIYSILFQFTRYVVYLEFETIFAYLIKIRNSSIQKINKMKPRQMWKKLEYNAGAFSFLIYFILTSLEKKGISLTQKGLKLFVATV